MLSWNDKQPMSPDTIGRSVQREMRLIRDAASLRPAGLTFVRRTAGVSADGGARLFQRFTAAAAPGVKATRFAEKFIVQRLQPSLATMTLLQRRADEQLETTARDLKRQREPIRSSTGIVQSPVRARQPHTSPIQLSERQDPTVRAAHQIGRQALVIDSGSRSAQWTALSRLVLPSSGPGVQSKQGIQRDQAIHRPTTGLTGSALRSRRPTTVAGTGFQPVVGRVTRLSLPMPPLQKRPSATGISGGTHGDNSSKQIPLLLMRTAGTIFQQMSAAGSAAVGRGRAMVVASAPAQLSSAPHSAIRPHGSSIRTGSNERLRVVPLPQLATIRDQPAASARMPTARRSRPVPIAMPILQRSGLDRLAGSDQGSQPSVPIKLGESPLQGRRARLTQSSRIPGTTSKLQLVRGTHHQPGSGLALAGHSPIDRTGLHVPVRLSLNEERSDRDTGLLRSALVHAATSTYAQGMRLPPVSSLPTQHGMDRAIMAITTAQHSFAFQRAAQPPFAAATPGDQQHPVAFGAFAHRSSRGPDVAHQRRLLSTAQQIALPWVPGGLLLRGTPPPSPTTAQATPNPIRAFVRPAQSRAPSIARQIAPGAVPAAGTRLSRIGNMSAHSWTRAATRMPAGISPYTVVSLAHVQRRSAPRPTEYMPGTAVSQVLRMGLVRAASGWSIRSADPVSLLERTLAPSIQRRTTRAAARSERQHNADIAALRRYDLPNAGRVDSALQRTAPADDTGRTGRNPALLRPQLSARPSAHAPITPVDPRTTQLRRYTWWIARATAMPLLLRTIDQLGGDGQGAYRVREHRALHLTPPKILYPAQLRAARLLQAASIVTAARPSRSMPVSVARLNRSIRPVVRPAHQERSEPRSSVAPNGTPVLVAPARIASSIGTARLLLRSPAQVSRQWMHMAGDRTSLAGHASSRKRTQRATLDARAESVSTSGGMASMTSLTAQPHGEPATIRQTTHDQPQPIAIRQQSFPIGTVALTRGTTALHLRSFNQRMADAADQGTRIVTPAQSQTIARAQPQTHSSRSGLPLLQRRNWSGPEQAPPVSILSWRARGLGQNEPAGSGTAPARPGLGLVQTSAPELAFVRPAGVQRSLDEEDGPAATKPAGSQSQLSRVTPPIPAVPSSTQAKPTIEALAQQVYQHIRRRLMIDQERLGRL